MFQIGEKIIYPMYGAGVIESIEQDFHGTIILYKFPKTI